MMTRIQRTCLALVLAVGGVCGVHAALLDNFYGVTNPTSFTPADRAVGNLVESWVAEDFYLDSSNPSYAGGMEVEAVHWLGRVITTSSYEGAEIIILEYVDGAYDEEAGGWVGGTFTPLLDPAGETPLAFQVREPGSGAEFEAPFPAGATTPDVFEFRVEIDPFVMNPDTLYLVGARLVGEQNRGSHEIASVGTHGAPGLTADHNTSVAAKKNESFFPSQAVDWHWIDQSPTNRTTNNEFAYQLHGTMIPEPTSLALLAAGVLVLRRRR